MRTLEIFYRIDTDKQMSECSNIEAMQISGVAATENARVFEHTTLRDPSMPFMANLISNEHGESKVNNLNASPYISTPSLCGTELCPYTYH